MSLFRRKSVALIDAEQFFHSATSPRGCRIEEDGRSYVITIHEQKVYLEPGDWIVKEPGCDRYYPVKDHIFKTTYELVQ